MAENGVTVGEGELKIIDWKDEKKRLSHVIAEHMDGCSQLDILVGFFYFNGIEQIRAALEQNPDIRIRILVGMSAGVDTKGLVEYAQRYEAAAEDEVRAEYRRQVREVVSGLGKANDNLNSKLNIVFYARMIDSGRLLIRQTSQENHSKLYIFHREGEPGTYIVGSSNFSRAGIADRQELNVQIQRTGVEQVKGLFNELWDAAVPLTAYSEFSAEKRTEAQELAGDRSKEPLTEPLAKTLTEETPFADISPYDAYLMLMQRYLALYEGEAKDERIRWMIESAGFDYLGYQADAVNRALTILRRSRGVLVADVVGLGKSVVGSTIAACYGVPGVILCPPHLITAWEGYVQKFHLSGWRVFSMYQLAEVKKHVKDWGMVIIDEAHRFRNKTLDGYEDLSSICGNRKVVLLTATPFNNRPRDIHALLGLFHDPLGLCPSGERFKDAMERLDKEYAKLMGQLKVPGLSKGEKGEIKHRIKCVAEQTFQIMSGVTIRRNRLDLEENRSYWNEVKDRMSKQGAPIIRKYKLVGEQSRFFDRVLTEYFGGEKRFTGAIYRPSRYLKGAHQQADAEDESTEEQTQENLYGMMCRFLVNRFESSFAAFKKSVESIKAYSETALKYFNDEHQFVLCREFFKRIEGVAEGEDFDFKAELQKYVGGFRKNGLNGKRGNPKAVTIYQDSEFQDIQAFKDAIQADISLLAKVLDDIDKLGLLQSGNDPKLNALIEAIGKVLENRYSDIKPEPKSPMRKVVVFSVFADTVDYVGKRLQEQASLKNRVQVVVGNGDPKDYVAARLLDDNVRKEVELNFDASKEAVTRPIDVLVTTDTISEGINLNRAGLVINYDIPWNPTRVIQRIGRINRISARVFESIYVMNFFPSDKGEAVINKGKTVKTKMQMIHDILREDAQVLDIDENPQAAELEKRISGAAGKSEEENIGEDTKVRERLEKCRQVYKGKEPWEAKMKRLAQRPLGLKTVARTGDQNSLTVFRSNGLMIYASCLTDIGKADENPNTFSFPVALDRVACEEGTPSDAFDAAYWQAYERVMQYRPILVTKKAGSLWKKASNVLDDPELYKRLPESLKEQRKKMLSACGKMDLSDAMMKQVCAVKTAKELARVVDEWSGNQRVAGGLEQTKEAEADSVPIMAIGAKKAF